MTTPNLDYLALRRFSDFVTGSPDAAAISAADFLALIQGGVTKRVSAFSLPGGLAQWAAAGGTADVITGSYPGLALPSPPTDGTLLGLRASAVNLTSTPTFSANGGTARTISKNAGQPLVAGDIPGSGYECLLRYRSAGTRWELLNPSSLLGTVRVVTAGASVTLLASDYFVGINKTVGAPTSVLLPGAPTIGKAYIVADLKGDADTNNITVSNGLFDGGANAFYVNQAYQSQSFEWEGTFWKVR